MGAGCGRHPDSSVGGHRRHDGVRNGRDVRHDHGLRPGRHHGLRSAGPGSGRDHFLAEGSFGWDCNLARNSGEQTRLTRVAALPALRPRLGPLRSAV